MHDLRTLAKELIELVQGVNNDVTVNGVVRIFNGVANGINLRWEDHITQKTNEVLAADKICCSKCSTPIRVIRTRQTITVDQE